MPSSDRRDGTVYLVDADGGVRRVVRELARSRGFRLATFSSAEEFLAAAPGSGPACVLVDLLAPDVGGPQILDRMARRDIHAAVVFLAARYDAATVVEAIRAGGVDFLEKPCRDRQMWARAILGALERDRADRRRRARQVSLARRLGLLTDGERRVLDGLMEGQSNRQIAAWLGVSVRAVEERRARLMKKMQAGSLAHLIRLVLAAENERAKTPGTQPPEGA